MDEDAMPALIRKLVIIAIAGLLIGYAVVVMFDFATDGFVSGSDTATPSALPAKILGLQPTPNNQDSK
jgi:hypothetical protein